MLSKIGKSALFLTVLCTSSWSATQVWAATSDDFESIPAPSSMESESLVLSPELKPANAPSAFETHLLYAQSSKVWSAIHELEAPEDNVQQMADLLSSRSTVYEEAFADVSLKLSGLKTGMDSPLLRTYYLGVSSDALAFGVVENPSSPELHADGIVSGGISTGFEGAIDSLGVQTRVGANLGLGRERRLDVTTEEIIPGGETESGRLSYYGLDLGGSHSANLNGDLRLDSSLSIRDTVFASAMPASVVSDGVGGTHSYLRWKLKNDFTRDSIRFETVAGPQPLPVELLPVTWDYAHQVKAFPALGAMLGAGMAFSGTSSPLTARAGFYGGYAGASLDLRSSGFMASIETFGIEASSTYQGLGQRIWAASLGLAL